VTPFGEPIVTTIERDESEVAATLDYGDWWWEHHGPDGVLPDIDGSDAARKHLERYAASGTLDAREMPEMHRLMASLRQARHDRIAAEGEEARLRNLLASAMAGHDRAEGQGWRITWSSVKGRVTTDWKLVATAYRRLLDHVITGEALPELAHLDVIEGLYTTTGEPTRSFRPTWTEEE
jgi:hypothetical protein